MLLTGRYASELVLWDVLFASVCVCVRVVVSAHLAEGGLFVGPGLEGLGGQDSE